MKISNNVFSTIVGVIFASTLGQSIGGYYRIITDYIISHPIINKPIIEMALFIIIVKILKLFTNTSNNS